MKTVLLPIKVPEGDYCWDWKIASCRHFDNCGGHETCDLKFYGQKQTDGGILKPRECLELEEDNRNALLEV